MEKRRKFKMCFYIVLIFFFLMSILLINQLNFIIQPVMWLVFAGIFYSFYPPVKERKRYIKNYFQMIGIFLLLYYVIYYLTGFFIGFHNSIKIENRIIYFVITIILVFSQEYVRGKLLLQSNEKSRLFIIALFTCMTTFFGCYYFYRDVGIFLIIMVIFANFSKNILCTYLSYDMSYKLSFFYRLITEGIFMIIPIFPNISSYLEVLLQIILPIFILDQVYRFSPIQYRSHKKKQFLFYPIAFVLLMISFLVLGLCRYQMIAVASNSMKPEFQRGDAVIFDKNVKEIKKGDIIVFHRGDKVIIHRVDKIVKDQGESYYRTKGDYNPQTDETLVSKEDIIGIVVCDIPYIGYPSIWIKG